MKRAVIVLVILIAGISGAILLQRRLAAAGPADKAQYKVAKAELGMVKKTVSATGTLQPWAFVDIKSKAGGRIDALLVDVGTRVKKGQRIALIDPADTQLSVDQAQADINTADARIQSSRLTLALQRDQSRLAVETAQAALEAARASRDAAKARLNTSRFQREAQPMLTSATVESARANYENAQKQLAEMKEATHPQERASAKSAVDQAMANLKNADANLNRQRILNQKEFVSDQVVDSAQASRDVAKAQLDTVQQKLSTLDREQAASEAAMAARVAQAKAQFENAKAGSVDVDIRKSSYQEAAAALAQSEKQVVNARKALDLAKANLANIDIRKTDILSAEASRMRAQAGLTNAAKTLQQTVVTAPNEGVVLKKYVEQGTIISSALSFAATGNNIVQIGDVSRMYVDVTVDETDIANVDEGQSVEVSIEAYPSIPFEGKVKRIDPQAVIEQNVTNIHVRVEIDNSDNKFQLLKPGMNATCEFVKAKKEDVLVVPTDAVRTDDQGQYIEVVTPGTGKPAPPDPKTGTPADADMLVDCKLVKRYINKDDSGQEVDHIEGNDSVEVVNGVKAGEMIVTQTIEPVVQKAGGAIGGGGFGGGGNRGGGGQRR